MNTIGGVGRACRLSLVAVALVAQASVRAEPLAAKVVLLVTGAARPAPNSDDDLLRRHLVAQGYATVAKALVDVDVGHGPDHRE